MMKSGAAERVVRHLLSVFGEKRAGLVLLLSGFLLSIPVFFDTVFFLLIPLARAMAIRAGGKYLYFVIAMAGAGAITHSMVPPTPGPLMIAEFLKIELGYALVAGLCASLPLAVMVLWLAGWFEKKYSFPMREVGGISSEDLKNTLAKNENELPPLFLSYLPILLPVVLISMISLLKVLGGQGIDLGAMAPTMENPNFRILSFFGEPNIAMALAALVSVILLVRQSQAATEDGKSILSKTLEAPLVTAGSIILITGAGGSVRGYDPPQWSRGGDCLLCHPDGSVLCIIGLGDHCICPHCPGFGDSCNDHRGWIDGLDHWRRELTSLPPGLCLFGHWVRFHYPVLDE
jgi:GntP family gluconate:H+ symporter